MNQATLVQLSLAHVDWPSTRSILGGSAFVPEALVRLVGANSKELAEKAYWELDNRVVVQGSLFEAAEYVISPLLVSLASGVSTEARKSVVDLLVEICLGEADETETALGNGELGPRCRRELILGLWQFYALLADPNSQVRQGAVLVLATLDENRPRLEGALVAVAKEDADVRVRAQAQEALFKLGIDP